MDQSTKMTDKNPLAHYSGVLSEAVQESAAEQIPASGQSRFHGQKWAECSVEHVAMVLAAPHEWKGYEVRYLYAAPVQAAPAAVAVPDERHPAALLQLADLLESGRHLIHVERKEVANALRTLAATPAAAPDMVSVKQVDANNYCRILAALGMEEEGDPVAEVQNLLAVASDPVVLPEPVGWRHSRTLTLHETEQEVQLADGDSHAQPLFTEQQVRALLAGVSAPAAMDIQMPPVTPEQFSRDIAELTGDALDDTALLNAMERQRIAVVPEYEGPWDAEVYNDDGEPIHAGSGTTPREAIRAAIAAAKGE